MGTQKRIKKRQTFSRVRSLPWGQVKTVRKPFKKVRSKYSVGVTRQPRHAFIQTLKPQIYSQFIQKFPSRLIFIIKNHADMESYIVLIKMRVLKENGYWPDTLHSSHFGPI